MVYKMVSIFLMTDIHVYLVEQGLTSCILQAKLVLSVQIKFYWCTAMPIHSLMVYRGRPYDLQKLKYSLSDLLQKKFARSCCKTSEKDTEK